MSEKISLDSSDRSYEYGFYKAAQGSVLLLLSYGWLIKEIYLNHSVSKISYHYSINIFFVKNRKVLPFLRKIITTLYQCNRHIQGCSILDIRIQKKHNAGNSSGQCITSSYQPVLRKPQRVSVESIRIQKPIWWNMPRDCTCSSLDNHA